MQNHLHDILHGMQHLLVRIMIRQHPRPAMRYLQKVISEIGTYVCLIGGIAQSLLT